MKRLAYLSGIAVLIPSGVYVFVYLYRWEWNRALIAGLFFVAAEIGLMGAGLFERIKRLEARIDERDSGRQPVVLERIQESRPLPKRPFAWLTERSDELNVFVPVLLGAGLVMSALAWLVERIATMTARPLLERRLVDMLAPIALPGSLAAEGPHLEAGRRTRFRAVGAARVMLVVVAALMAVKGIDVLGDLTQSRPDVIQKGTQSHLVVEMSTRDGQTPPLGAARALWGACRYSTYASLSDEGIRSLSGNRVRLTVEPSLGVNAEKKLHGCIEDALLSGIQARVVGITALP
jgi:hypothetical protein